MKGATKTKYKVGTLNRLLRLDSDANSTTNFKQIFEILKKTYKAAATPQPLSGTFSTSSQSLVHAMGCCQRKPFLWPLEARGGHQPSLRIFSMTPQQYELIRINTAARRGDTPKHTHHKAAFRWVGQQNTAASRGPAHKVFHATATKHSNDN